MARKAFAKTIKKSGSGKGDPGLIGMADRFALLNRVILRDLNSRSSQGNSYFRKYKKDDIHEWLKSPETNEKNLRDAMNYMYQVSPHLRRLVQYFVSLSDLSYVILPYRINPDKQSEKRIAANYYKTLELMALMSVKTQFDKILTVCLREDVFYGTIWETKDNITIQQLPSDYCRITTIEGNVPNVTFDFNYFSTNSDKLPFYPPEFEAKYRLYEKDRSGMRYQELDCPTSFAIKCNKDILAYATPPFVGLLREIYDIEDYKDLKLTKTAIENYALISMKVPLDDEGGWKIDETKAREFWGNLSGVLPEEVGSVLTPMDIQKVDFQKSNTGDTNAVAEAEEDLFTAAGVSSLLFNNPKASANALMLSIKADQAITFGIVKSIQDMVNRYLQSKPFGKNFTVEFLDVSPFNRKEAGDIYLKACQYGVPMVSYYCASQGLGQSEMNSMNYLENEILGIKKSFIPLKSSATQSASDADDPEKNPEGGAPVKDDDELTEQGEQHREDA